MNEILLPGPECCTKDVEVSQNITDRLTQRKRRLEIELRETDEALRALEENPNVTKVLTLVGRAVGRFC